MFRFAQAPDYVLMAVGIIAAICNGGSMPLFALLFGNMLDSFKTLTDLTSITLYLLLVFIYLGVAVFVTGWIMIGCWSLTGERQSI
jgi:ATP-binding cassette subfamily B (MDR/TAP) protein 1